MARGKKKGRSGGNKKKNRNTRNVQGGDVSGAQQVPASSQQIRGGTRIPSNILRGSKPDFKELERATALQKDYPTVYTRYKQASARFINYMKDQTPGGDEMRSVDSLMVAADWMEENNHVVPSSVLKDLKIAIRIRSRVAKSLYGGGDSGHKHFILVLTYCWTVLNRLPMDGITFSTIADTCDSANDSTNAEKNRFATFAELDNEDEGEDDEDIFPSSAIPRPDPAPEPMTLEELMSSDDRNDAILFLMSLDELMGFVSEQYKAVLKCHYSYQQSGISPLAMIEMYLEAAVATNMIIQKVQQLEMDLQTQHKHLTTPYRLLSTLVLPDIVRHSTNVLQEHATKRCDEKTVTSFLGDCLECFFRNPSDIKNQAETIVADFCTEFLVNETGTTELQQVFDGLSRMVPLEVPVGPENSMNAGFMSTLSSLIPSIRPHSWLPKSDFIGRDRSIHHTIRLLQQFSDIIYSTPVDRQVVAKPGFFGSSPWRPSPSRKINGDLDELLMADILPQWVTMCRKGILGIQKLPKENEICPLLVLLREYVEQPGKPVTWSIAFSIHSILTAVLESGQVFDEIISVSKMAFKMYFDQVRNAFEIVKQEKDTHINQAYAQNMMSVLYLENLGLDVFGDRAIWNPLCGGTILSYISYFGNLEAGCTLVDYNSQLRITLHLYHALLENGILQNGQIPFLDIQYDIFKSSRGVWEGPLPKRGEFVKRFWICFGMNPKEAERMAQEAQKNILELRLGFNRFSSRQLNEASNRMQASFKTRKLRPIEPSDISKSFRRVCERDFHDVVDNYHTPKQRRENKGSDIYEVSVYTNDTLDAIDNEQSVLSSNLIGCGAFMEQFVCSLSRIMQWDQILSTVGASLFQTDKRQGFVFIYAQYLLGALDYSHSPTECMFLDVPLGTASSCWMKEFFNRVPPSTVTWFQATETEE